MAELTVEDLRRVLMIPGHVKVRIAVGPIDRPRVDVDREKATAVLSLPSEAFIFDGPAEAKPSDTPKPETVSLPPKPATFGQLSTKAEQPEPGEQGNAGNVAQQAEDRGEPVDGTGKGE